VRRIDNRVVVNVQLIDARTDRPIWAERYDRTIADSLGLQGELATEIAMVSRQNSLRKKRRVSQRDRPAILKPTSPISALLISKKMPTFRPPNTTPRSIDSMGKRSHWIQPLLWRMHGHPSLSATNSGRSVTRRKKQEPAPRPKKRSAYRLLWANPIWR
jgi:hypothetical protein